MINDQYIILDPYAAAIRGYLNSVTGQTYDTGYQPFAKNLTAAMADKYNRSNSP